MKKSVIVIVLLFLIVGNIFVIAETDESSAEDCSFWCTISHFLFGNPENRAGKGWFDRGNLVGEATYTGENHGWNCNNGNCVCTSNPPNKCFYAGSPYEKGQVIPFVTVQDVEGSNKLAFHYIAPPPPASPESSQPIQPPATTEEVSTVASQYGFTIPVTQPGRSYYRNELGQTVELVDGKIRYGSQNPDLILQSQDYNSVEEFQQHYPQDLLNSLGGYEGISNLPGDYGDNKQTVDALYQAGLLTPDQYGEVKGGSLFNWKENMLTVRTYVQNNNVDALIAQSASQQQPASPAETTATAPAPTPPDAVRIIDDVPYTTVGENGLLKDGRTYYSQLQHENVIVYLDEDGTPLAVSNDGGTTQEPYTPTKTTTATSTNNPSSSPGVSSSTLLSQEEIATLNQFGFTSTGGESGLSTTTYINPYSKDVLTFGPEGKVTVNYQDDQGEVRTATYSNSADFQKNYKPVRSTSGYYNPQTHATTVVKDGTSYQYQLETVTVNNQDYPAYTYQSETDHESFIFVDGTWRQVAPDSTGTWRFQKKNGEFTDESSEADPSTILTAENAKNLPKTIADWQKTQTQQQSASTSPGATSTLQIPIPPSLQGLGEVGSFEVDDKNYFVTPEGLVYDAEGKLVDTDTYKKIVDTETYQAARQKSRNKEQIRSEVSLINTLLGENKISAGDASDRYTAVIEQQETRAQLLRQQASISSPTPEQIKNADADSTVQIGDKTYTRNNEGKWVGPDKQVVEFTSDQLRAATDLHSPLKEQQAEEAEKQAEKAREADTILVMKTGMLERIVTNEETWKTIAATQEIAGGALSLMNRFGQYQALSNLIAPDLTKDWQNVANNEFLNKWADLPNFAIEKACRYDERKRQEQPGQSTSVIRQPGRIDIFVGSIQAERSSVRSPILCQENTDPESDEEWVCGQNQVCVDETFCYADDDNDGRPDNPHEPEQGYFYKITWGVAAPSDHSFTPNVDEEDKAVKFNIQLQGDGEIWLYNRGGMVGSGVIELENGQSDRDVILHYSNRQFTIACLRYHPEHIIKDYEGDKVSDQCVKFQISERGQVEYSESSRTSLHSTTSGTVGRNSNW